MNPSDIIETATSLQSNHNKRELTLMARGLGWKGDEARTPLLQLCLFIATKLASGDRAENHAGQRDAKSEEGQQPQQPQQPQGDNGSPTKDQREYEQGQQQQGQQQGQQQQGQQEGQQQGQQEGQPEGDDGRPPEGQQESQQGDAKQEGEDAPKDWDEFAARVKADQKRQQQGQQQGQQEDEPEPEEIEPPAPDEFEQLLKASGIMQRWGSVHALLHKVWLLSAKAKQNVLLIGPAGCGKTMLAEQLAALLRVPFGSISCTMGMSESQLTGWLLPVGDNGRFDYVPSPFVTCVEQASVFLADELDGADPNVLLLLNSMLSNGFMSIPHKLGTPTVKRHVDACFIAGANTGGSGGDELYSARAALDAATVDRFWPIAVGYDAAYEASIFAIDKKARRKSPKWTPAAPPDQFGYDALHTWFVELRKATSKAKLSKVVSSRMAQRIVAGAKVGIPVNEIKADMLLSWSVDELARVDQSGVR